MNWYKSGQTGTMPMINQNDGYIASAMNTMRSIESSSAKIEQLLDKARLPDSGIHFEPWILDKITTARNDLNDARLGLSEQIGGK